MYKETEEGLFAYAAGFLSAAIPDEDNMERHAECVALLWEKAGIESGDAVNNLTSAQAHAYNDGGWAARDAVHGWVRSEKAAGTWPEDDPDDAADEG